MPPLPANHDPFEYHKPNEDEIFRIEQIRKAFLTLYRQVGLNTRQGSVSGRYVSLSKTALEEACMWATKSIVFERDNQDPGG